jgi:hypothetical protein
MPEMFAPFEPDESKFATMPIGSPRSFHAD